jgi:hypothetical protein
MANNVKIGRAVSVDGVPDTLFKISRHKDCEETKLCKRCIKKVGFL